jgi:Flp pilus assembly protein TadD
VRALRRAAAMDPNNDMTHHLLWQTYRDMGMKEEADREMRIAQQLRKEQNAR